MFRYDRTDIHEHRTHTRSISILVSCVLFVFTSLLRPFFLRFLLLLFRSSCCCCCCFTWPSLVCSLMLSSSSVYNCWLCFLNNSILIERSTNSATVIYNWKSESRVRIYTATIWTVVDRVVDAFCLTGCFYVLPVRLTHRSFVASEHVCVFVTVGV